MINRGIFRKMCKIIKKDPRAREFLRKKLNNQEFMHVMHLVLTNKTLYKNGKGAQKKSISNPFQMVCYSYNRENLEAFFSDHRLFNAFLAIEPLIRQAGHEGRPARLTTGKGIKYEEFIAQLDQLKAVAIIVDSLKKE